MNITSQTPQWGINYDVGYVFFTFNSQSIISNGIAYFEHWSALKDIKVSHTGGVTGPDACIEALTKGVVRSDLQKYFQDPHTQIFFRKPKLWTPFIGGTLVREWEKFLGQKYGYGLIVAHALANSFGGKLINWIFRDAPDRWVSRLLDNKRAAICSEVIASGFENHPIYNTLLLKPARMYDPKELFLSGVFQEWDGKE